MRLGKPSSSREDNIKSDIKERGARGVDQIHAIHVNFTWNSGFYKTRGICLATICLKRTSFYWGYHVMLNTKSHSTAYRRQGRSAPRLASLKDTKQGHWLPEQTVFTNLLQFRLN